MLAKGDCLHSNYCGFCYDSFIIGNPPKMKSQHIVIWSFLWNNRFKVEFPRRPISIVKIFFIQMQIVDDGKDLDNCNRPPWEIRL